MAGYLGLMDACIEQSLQYAKQRQQFGKPIAQFQLIRSRLADMKMLLEASRLLVYRSAWMIDQGLDVKADAALAKCFMTESFQKVADMAVDIHGGYGYMREYAVEMMYRDAKLGVIGAGTSDIQRLIISSNMLQGK